MQDDRCGWRPSSPRLIIREQLGPLSAGSAYLGALEDKQHILIACS